MRVKLSIQALKARHSKAQGETLGKRCGPIKPCKGGTGSPGKDLCRTFGAIGLRCSLTRMPYRRINRASQDLVCTKGYAAPAISGFPLQIRKLKC